MPWNEQGRMIALMLAAVVALAAGEVLLAKGMRAAPGGEGGWTAQVVGVLASPWIWAGAGLLLIHLVLYMAALGKADLSFVLPLTAASYPLTTLLSRYYLNEHVGTSRWIGIALITVGVAVVGLCDASTRH
jgi:drug/metabolite transporter (DMT)-like permease